MERIATVGWWQDWHGRGLVAQSTRPDLGEWVDKQLQQGPLYCYAGFDPTADSLHVGSLLPALSLRRLKQVGLKPIVVVGGATGMIGDPSGKTAERTLLSLDALQHNVRCLSQQLEKLLDGKVGVDFLLVNNFDWIGPLRFIDFLRDVGKHFSVNMMIAKESVRARLEDRDHGISYTEFSYMLLQAYDFLHLYEQHGCQLQIGGSDQWGNITAGIDLIHHRHHGVEAHGLTMPLLTNAAGQKFGKSERGNLWLDPQKTHPYFVYKHFFHVEDVDVVRFLKLLTLVPLPEIEALAAQVQSAPQLRSAQQRLAREVTAVVHGSAIADACAGLEAALHADDEAAFETNANVLGLLDPASLAADADMALLPVAHRPLSSLQGAGLDAVELAIELGLFKSKSDARREITGPNSGFVVAGQQITDPQFRITADLVGARRVLQIRKGKKNKRMICLHD